MLTATVVPKEGKVVNVMPVFKEFTWAQGENGQLHGKLQRVT